MGPEEIFLKNLEFIERFARATCRRFGMGPADADDFTSELKLKLIENDYAALRKFEGRSSIATFLYIIMQRFSFDYRNQEWGRWRPSAEAQRQGEIAVLFEQCRHRDEMTIEEACDTVRQKHPEVSAAEVLRLGSTLPQRELRTKWKRESFTKLQSMAGPWLADEGLLAGERLAKAGRASKAFGRALGELTPEEQLILRLRFGQGLKVVTIANVLQLDQKRLYITLERLIRTLRKALLTEGLSSADVGEMLEHGAEGIEIPFLEVEGIAAHDAPHMVKEEPTGAGQAD